MLGPLPAVKLSSFPPRGQGVTPDTVRPSPGISVQVMPSTDVFRAAWPASMDTTPSPSTKPIKHHCVSHHRRSQLPHRNSPVKPSSTTVLFAVTSTGTLFITFPLTVASIVTVAPCAPSATLLQSTLTYTLCSGCAGEIEPLEDETCTHDSFATMVNVKEVGPPAPMSM